MKYFNPINEFFLEDKFQSIVLFNHVLAFLLRDTNSQKYPTRNTYTHTIHWTSRARVHRVCEIANFHVPKVPKALVSPTTRKLQGFQFVPFKSRRCFPPLRLIQCGVEIDRRALSGGAGLSSIIDTLTLITPLVVIGKKLPFQLRGKLSIERSQRFFFFFFLPILRKRLNDCTIPFPIIEGKEGELSGRIFKVDIDSNIG